MTKGPRLFLFLLVIVSAVAVVRENAILPHEPISVVKSLQGIEDRSSPWNVLSRSMNDEEVFGVFDQLEKRIKPLIANKIVIAIHGDNVVLDHLPKGVNLTYNVTIPHANLLSLMAASLSILFEKQEPKFFMIPVKEIFAKSDVVIPKPFHSKNLVQLLNTVSKISQDSVGFLNELNLQGRITVQTANAIIKEKTKRAAWRNALSFLGLDGGDITDSNHVIAPLEDFYMLLNILLSSFRSATTYPDMDLPYWHPDHYTFGWWLNCNLKGACLNKDMPEEAVFSASPNMRLYVMESLDLVLAVIHTTQLSVNTLSFNKLLEADNVIWSQLLELITPPEEDLEETPTREESTDRQQQPEAEASDDVEREEKKEGQDHLEQEDLEETPTREESTDGQQQPEAEASDDVQREEKKKRQDHLEQEEQKEGNTDTQSDNTQTPRSSPFLEPLYTVLRQVKHYFNLYLDYTGRQHWFVRGLLWVTFVTVAHVVVYYWLHWFWFLLKTIVPWTHQPRPKLD